MRSDPTSTEAVLELSKSRTYDCALDILGAYKLTNNFHVNLEIVLKDLNALDDLTFDIEPKPALGFHSDRRRVVFRRNRNIGANRFGAALQSINERIGSAANERSRRTGLLDTSLRLLGDTYNALMKLRPGRSRIHTGRWAH
jgi:hypothetical protein